MKKLVLLWLVVGLLFLSLVPLTVQADDTKAVTFTVSSAYGDVGDTVPVSIYITGESEIGGLELELSVPTEYLESTTVLDKRGRPVYYTGGEAAAGAVLVVSAGSTDLDDGQKGMKLALAHTSGLWEEGLLVTYYFTILQPLPEGGIALSCRVAEISHFSQNQPRYEVATPSGIVGSLVDQVLAMIDALPTVITLQDQEQVQAARDGYDALSDTQKPLITNLSKLEDAEQTILDLLAAKAVEEQIDQLNVVSIADKPAVQAARAAYDALTETQKSYVPNLQKLLDAEAALLNMVAYGDLDGDTVVTAADALEVLKSVVGKVVLTDEQTIVADVDGSGEVDAADALNILKKVVGKIQTFPVEQA
ncbi:MAG: dockerin type I repeat-containing protein [Clostridia bacterium]|nr:dockerin type I repeat-containing protein [Clostridia bacterium]